MKMIPGVLMVIRTMVLMVAMVPSSGASLSEENPVIQVRPIVEIDGSHQQIVLGDLMIARGVSPSTLTALKNVRLADTPKPGESRVFTALGLEQVFKQSLRDIEINSGEKVALRIPTRVTVVRKSFRLSVDDVMGALQKQFKELCVDCEFDIVGLSLPVIPTAVPAGANWKITTKHDLPKGSFSLPLEVINEDMSKRSYWISGTLNVRRRVPVAARSLAPGERVSPQDFSMHLRDVTFATDSPASEAELLSSVAARAVAAGQIVWRNQLHRELAAKIGDAVKVTAGAENWEISMDGIVQSGGYIGDLVKVKIPRTQKLISGILTAAGKVEVR